jgi:hypothetical protein
LKKIELTNSGIILLGAFYELKPQKVKKGQAQLPYQKLENYYLLIQQEVNGNATLQAIPVFTELGPYSPSYQIHNQNLHLLFNGHVKNSFMEGEKPTMLFNKDVSKKAQLVASTLQVSSGKINYQVLSTSQEKIRFLSASAQQKGNVFFVDVIEKSSANEFRKNIVKTAAINFIL